MDVINAHIPPSVQPQFVSGYNSSLEKYWTPGLQLLHSLNPDIYRHGYYPNGNTAALQLLASGSIWMAPLWSDQSLDALKEHQLPPTIKLEQITPPLAGGPADITVLKTCPDKKAADAFVNWLLSQKAQTLIVDDQHGYPGIEWKYMPSSVRKEFSAIAKSYATGWSNPYISDMNAKWQNQVPAS
jgi:putative spermidine/putrescine transport system substrate-binding protein